tara:strand:- start:120 stop:401 length:282 start_codon:yes stop_codon:yes gene_type:complete
MTLLSLLENYYSCFNEGGGKNLMAKGNQAKAEDGAGDNIYRPLSSGFIEKTRLNVNDLIEKRRAEKKQDSKKNILIFSGATAVAAVVLIIISL